MEESISGYWIAPEDLDSDFGSDPSADEACAMASFILWAFAGRKYGRTRTVTETYECACSRDPLLYMPYRQFAVPYTLGDGAVRNLAGGCSCQGVLADGRHVRLRLRGTPVRKVHFVRKGQENLPPSSYRVENSGLLTIDSGHPWDVCGLEVSYTYGTGVPLAGRMAAKLLAQEFIKSWSGLDGCRLPDRVTNVSRQGISFTVLDKQDFLDELRTGIYEVDLFLRAVNPDKARKKARVFSPDVPRAYRSTASDYRRTSFGSFDEYQLAIIAGAPLNRGFRNYDNEVAQSLLGYSFAAEIRETESPSSPIVLDLTPFLALNGTDSSLLEISIPDTVTEALSIPSTAYWELRVWPTGDTSSSSLWLRGPAVLDPIYAGSD